MTTMQLAQVDIANHKQAGADLNQFSTQEARALWQQGFDDVTPSRATVETLDWRIWQRGRCIALLMMVQP
jgi:hypothetical protein